MIHYIFILECKKTQHFIFHNLSSQNNWVAAHSWQILTNLLRTASSSSCGLLVAPAWAWKQRKLENETEALDMQITSTEIKSSKDTKRNVMLDMMVYYWIKYVAYKTTPLWKMRVADSKRWRQNLTELNIELTNDNYYIITIRGHPIKLYKKLWL